MLEDHIGVIEVGLELIHNSVFALLVALLEIIRDEVTYLKLIILIYYTFLLSYISIFDYILISLNYSKTSLFLPLS